MSSFIKIIQLISVLLIFFISQKACGQDILTLKSGREIKAVIVEENENILKYREFGIDNSPLYTIEKAKVESVKYGRKQSSRNTQPLKNEEPVANVNPDQPTGQSIVVKKRFVLQDGRVLSPRQVKTIMEDNQEAVDIYSKGQKQVNAGNACPLGVVAVCFVAGMTSNKMEDPERKAMLATGLGVSAGLAVTGIVLLSKGKKNIRKAVDLYNTGATKPSSYKIDLRLSATSVGIAMKF